MSFTSVVLPQPDSPTRPSVSPGPSEQLTRSTAWIVVVARLSTPLRWRYVLLTSLASRIVSAMSCLDRCRFRSDLAHPAGLRLGCGLARTLGPPSVWSSLRLPLGSSLSRIREGHHARLAAGGRAWPTPRAGGLSIISDPFVTPPCQRAACRSRPAGPRPLYSGPAGEHCRGGQRQQDPPRGR